MESLLDLGFVGLVSFGAVGVINALLPRLTSYSLSGESRLLLFVVVAFLVGFIPQDLGVEVFNRIKEAVAIGLAVHALWTVRKSV